MKTTYIDQFNNTFEYEESFWTGKKKIRVNGHELNHPSKKEFIINQQTYILKGNIIFGAKLTGPAEIIIVPKLKPWEYIFVILPLILVLIGGAIGAVIGMLAAILIAVNLRKIKNVLLKILFSLGVGAAAYLIWNYIVIYLLSLLY